MNTNALLFKYYIVSSPCAVPCPIGWVMDPNKTKCFLHVGRPQSWNDSETCCSKYGGHLVSLTSLQELQFAQSLCGESINSCWIGGQRLNSTAGYQWMWSNNSPWNNSIFSMVNVPPHCNGTGPSCHRNSTDNLCTVVTNNSNSLITERCDNPHASLCILDIGMFSLYISLSILTLHSLENLVFVFPFLFILFPKRYLVFEKFVALLLMLFFSSISSIFIKFFNHLC